MSVAFARGRLLNSAGSTLIEVASGIIPNGGNLPTTMIAGDRIILTAVTAHDNAAGKTITAVPAGFSFLASSLAEDFIPDLHVYVKSAELVDRGRSVSFGTKVGEIQYVIARGGGNLFTSLGASSYFSSVNIAPVARTGLHILPVAMSQGETSIATGPGSSWALRGDTTVGAGDYGASALWTRLGGPASSTSVAATAATTSMNALEILVEGISVPAAPAAPVLGATAGDGQVSLSWTEPAAYPAITSYAVKRWNGSSFVIVATTSSRTYINTGLVNGTEYRFVVTATNSVNESVSSNEVVRTPTAATSGTYDNPAAPNLDITGATTVATGANLAALVDAAAANAVFYLPDGTYTNIVDVKPKAGMRFVGESEAGVILDGGGTRVRAFRGRGGSNTPGVVIANMTLQNYGTSGSKDQSIGVIDAKGNTTGYEGSPDKWMDARIHNVTIKSSANVGIWFGDRWLVDNCVFENLNPQAIGAGKGVGGRITRCHFEKCGASGASGAGVNYAAIKLVLWNVGPHGSGQGSETHQQLWQSGVGSNPLEPAAAQVTQPASTLVIDNNTFDCATPGAGVSGGKTRGIWLDLDVRDCDIFGNVIDDPYVGIFPEGCNDIWIHGNTINRAGTFTPSGGRHGNIYFGHGGICWDATTNITVEDNVVLDSQCAIVGFLGRRDQSGADWVTDGSEYALGGYIARNYNVISSANRSNLGTNNCVVRNNTLTGTSTGFGMLLSPDMNTSTETHPATWVFTGNDFVATSGAWWWQGTKYASESAWQGLGFQ